MNTTTSDALPAQQLGISKGDRVGHRLDGAYESAIVLAVASDGLWVTYSDDKPDRRLWLHWSEVLPGF